MRQVLFRFRLPGTGIEVPIFGYGVFVFLGFLAACWLAARRARARGVSPERMLDLGISILLAGIVGGRLFWIAMFHDQVRSLYDVVAIWEGGLVLYGGVIGGTLAFFLFARLFNLPVRRLVDIVAPAIILGVGIGRLGCFMNGCCWGDPTLVPWAVQFPVASPPYMQHLRRGLVSPGFEAETSGGQVVLVSVLPGGWADHAGLRATDRIVAVGRPGSPLRAVRSVYDLLVELRDIGTGERVQLDVLRSGERVPLSGVFRPVPPGSLPIHPTQLYSFVGAACIAWFLCAARLERIADGINGPALMILYGVHRFLIEILRDDLPPVALGLTIAQWVSLVLIGLAIPLGWLLVRAPGRPALKESSPAV